MHPACNPTYPAIPYALQVPKHARLEGMLALSVKREPRETTETKETTMPPPTPAATPAASSATTPAPAGATAAGGEQGGGQGDKQTLLVAAGTAALESGEGCVLSCSDKILR